MQKLQEILWKKMTEQDEQIMELDSTVRCKLAPSSISGIGVFAIQDIKKGEKLYCIPSLSLKWYSLSYGSFGKLFSPVRELILERWPSIINGSHFVSPNDMVWLITFMNHSETPNYNVDTDTALQDIKAGEEVTENYKLMTNYQKIYPWLKS